MADKAGLLDWDGLARIRVRQSVVKEKNSGVLSIKKVVARVLPKGEPGRSSDGSSVGESSSSSSHRDSNSGVAVEDSGVSGITMQIETEKAVLSPNCAPNSSIPVEGAGAKDSHLRAMRSALEVGLVGSSVEDKISRLKNNMSYRNFILIAVYSYSLLSIIFEFYSVLSNILNNGMSIYLELSYDNDAILTK